MRLLLAIVLASATVAAAEEWYQDRVDLIMEKCDENEDEELDLDEFTCVMIDALDMQDAFDNAGTDIDAEFANAGGGDGSVTEDEFVDYVVDADEDIQGTMFKNLAGVNLDMPDTEGLAEVSDNVLAAEFIVKLKLTLAVNPEDLFAGDIKQIGQAIKDTIDPDGKWITDDLFTMLIMTGSSVVTTSAFAPNAADAQAAEENLAEEMGDKEAASDLLGFEVTEDPEIEVTASAPTLEINTTLPIIIGVVAVLLGFITCFLAKRSGNKRRALWGTDYAGCCSTGCCSGYGLKGWSQGTILAAIFLIGSAIPMYTQMSAVALRLQCIIDSVLELSNMEGDGAAIVSSLGEITSILAILSSNLGYLGLAAILPAALAAVFMLLSAFCALRTSSTMCCAKFFAFLNHILLILSAVLYIIFGAIGIAVTLEFARPYLKLITGICETKIPILAELSQGAQQALDMAKSGGADASDLADIQDAVDILQPTYEIFDTACDCLSALMFDLAGLLIPGAVAAVASFYGLYSIHGLCCAANCCYAPTGAGKPDGSGATISKTDQAVQDV